MRTVAFVEIDEWCRRHLAHHWPGVPVLADIRSVEPEQITASAGVVDVICGGFPCQDISEAGKRVGIDGARSGLWAEMFRLVRGLRPDWVIAENVAAIRYRGYDRVAADLAEAGYTCRPLMVAALHVGATQERKRAWIVANANHPRLQRSVGNGKPNPPRQEREAACSEPLRSTCGRWPPGPGAVTDIPRMADGPADRVHRLKALGNTIVPQIPELIGRAIMNLSPNGRDKP
jgi:DNA (cytosine-5)-methyltransferase 1